MGRGEGQLNPAVGWRSAGAAPKNIAEDVALGQLVERFEQLCPEADGVWTCDGGAAFAAWLCDQAGLPRRLRSGLYWHPTIESYNETMGYAEGSDDWATWREEAHCWVEIDRPYGTVILDPNSERLPEPLPRLSLYDREQGLLLSADGEWVESGYEPINGERDCVDYDEDEDIEELAKTDRTLRAVIAKARRLLESA